MPAVTTRPVDPGDTSLLLEIFTHSGDVPAILAVVDPNLLQMQFNAQRAGYDAQFPGAVHEIILVDGEPAGHVWWAERADEIRVLDVTLLPRFRRRGAGTSVYTTLLSHARELGKPVGASVERHNSASLAFHQRLGFRVTGEIETHLLLTTASDSSPE